LSFSKLEVNELAARKVATTSGFLDAFPNFLVGEKNFNNLRDEEFKSLKNVLS